MSRKFVTLQMKRTFTRLPQTGNSVSNQFLRSCQGHLTFFMKDKN